MTKGELHSSGEDGDGFRDRTTLHIIISLMGKRLLVS